MAYSKHKYDPDAAKAKVQDALQRLDAGISALTTSKRWAEFLKFQSRFHKYSFGNAMLIEVQRPDATRVAGFRTWLGMGHTVKKGEKGIMILAPRYFYKSKETREILRNAAEVSPNDKVKVTYFVASHVFDISQTEGPPLPEIASRLEGDAPQEKLERLQALARSLGYTVIEAEHGAAHGYMDPHAKVVATAPGLSPLHRLKTTIHEIAHIPELLGKDMKFDDRQLEEVAVESVAFIVSDYLGLDTSSYSFDYVANWGSRSGNQGEIIKTLQNAGRRIQKAAEKIIEAMEGREIESPELAATPPEDQVEAPEAALPLAV
jgi:antirestriction protein ArdC